MKLNYDYITHWETEHEEGLRGAFDAEQRDKEMDADGVAAEVIFPDADAITGMESPPFGAGLVGRNDRGSRARVRGRARAQPLPRRAVRDEPRPARRHRPRADHPRRRTGGRRDRVAGRQARHPRDHGPDDVARPHAVQRPVVRPGVGRVRGREPAGARALGRGAARGDERLHRHLSRRGRVLDAPADRAPVVQWRVRTVPGTEVRRHRGRVATGSPT